MAFLTPIFLFLGLLAVPIILLYMLRLRRREILVSSTMLWQKLLRDREANAPWQKLRRNLLLLLQLLILAALVLALARPFIPIPSIVSGSVVVLLDASASMQSTDLEPSRFEAAKVEVNQLINELSGNNQMTIIKAGQTPAVLVSATNDHNQLRQVIEKAQPDPSTADWYATFALAAGAAQGFRNSRIVLISDGGLPNDLPPLPVEIIYIPIGFSGENLAITALATRATETGPQLFASVRNEGITDQQALFSLTLDGTLFDSRRITVPGGNTTNLTWRLPENTAVIQGTLNENNNDFLDLDDTAWAVHEGGVSNRTLLITKGNLFLEQVYSVLPGIEAFKTGPDSDLINENAEPFDLYVFDSVALPEPPPPTDLLIINPQPGDMPASSLGQIFNITGAFSNTIAIRLADNPLLQFVDWRNVHIRQAKTVSAPWAQPIVMAEGGPLILVGEQNNRRIAIITFDLHDSDLPLQIAFPVLMANITGWLSPGRAFDAPTGLQPGLPVGISSGLTASSILVKKPDGTTWTAETGEDEIFFTETDQLGLYQVTLRDSGGDRQAGSFAVNLFSPIEANIGPAEKIRVGQTTIDTSVEGDIGQKEFWPWLLSAAFVILLVEWWVHHRGTQLPKFNLR